MRIKGLFLSFGLMFVFIFFLFCPNVSSQEKELMIIAQQTEGMLGLNKILENFKGAIHDMDDANREAGRITGTKVPSVTPAKTPEQEAERRREIINSQYEQAKNMLGALAQDEENPQIAQALPIEGYLIVDGGEKELWGRDQIKTDLIYRIKEKFVGNIIVLHTYNIIKGSFEKEKEYELDTLSTGIDVINLAGKKCAQWSSGSPSVCTRWANLSIYEIDPGEHYPQFYSNTASLNPHGDGKIKIEARAPTIIFRSSDGKTSTKLGCSMAEWIITGSEFETLFKRGEIRLNKAISSLSCRPGSTMELYIKLKKDEEPQLCKNMEHIKLEIIKPENKSKYLYSGEYALMEDESNRLELELEAKVEPERYADSIEWEIPKLEGSKKIFIPASLSEKPRGKKVKVIYKGLPESYKEFGKKTVTASLKVDSCTIEDKKEVVLFYPRDEKNNPEGKYPNWFYYWKQTPASRPFGQNVNIVFGGTEFDLCKGEHVMAIFKPGHLFKSIHVCDLSKKVGGNFEVTIPWVSRKNPATLKTKHYITYTHIDTFAVLIMHEFTHFNHHHTWWSGKTRDQITSEDRDGDGIPDRLEPEMGFIPGVFQTYFGDDMDFKNINGDEEFLAYESTYDYPIGKYDDYDWGKPGKNWW